MFGGRRVGPFLGLGLKSPMAAEVVIAEQLLGISDLL